MRTVILGLTAMLAACSGDTQFSWNTRSGEMPLVIAHRGASGELPEHTIEAYALAIEQGSDVIEPDLVVTADGVLVARHDAYLSTTTNVAEHPEFANRRRELFDRDDWWVFDFTLEELRSLRAVQPQPGRDPSFDGQFGIPSFREILAFVDAQESACECIIPVEPEVKHPRAFAAAGLDPLPILIHDLQDFSLFAEDAPVVVQSFDADFLIRTDALAPVRLAMLYSSPDNDGGDMNGLPLEGVAKFSDVLGANKALLLDADGRSTGLLEQAHALGLEVHAWTVRDDREPHVGETVQDELVTLYELGVDAVFTDYPATAVRVRDEMVGELP
jgi:glycerophosphoryl diester phosphodiesterase